MEQLSHTTATVTVAAIPSKPQPYFKNPNDVEFEVKYADDYKGVKRMPEGKVIISKESAEQFTKAGIGKVVEATEPVKGAIEQSAEADETPKQKSSSKSKDKK